MSCFRNPAKGWQQPRLAIFNKVISDAQQILHNCEILFLDVNECKGNHSCHKNAKCTNTIGSHVCECQPGYTGDGRNCTGEFDRFYLTNREALTVLCLILLGCAWKISFSSLSLLMYYHVYIADRLLIALYSRFCLIFYA